MNPHSTSPIRVRVDPTNPGQFFACSGLLELADRLAGGAEGWFEEGEFLIFAEADHLTLAELLAAARSPRLLDTPEQPAELADNEGDEDRPAPPLVLESPVRLQLDWWRDTSLKTWAGRMDAALIFLAMCAAIDPNCPDPLSQEQVVLDGEPTSTPDRRPGRKGAARPKREPFYFDSRRGCNAMSLDIGFSPDALDMRTTASPVVEAMCLLGLQRCRPVPTGAPRVFTYCTWDLPLAPCLVPAAVSGRIPLCGIRMFRFRNSFRTDQRKHKAFTAATEERYDP